MNETNATPADTSNDGLPVPTTVPYRLCIGTAIGEWNMPGRRTDDTDVTLGEVYRLVQAVKEEHGNKLDAIDAQVRITNGRTTTLESQVGTLQRDVQAMRPVPPPQTPPGLPVMTPEGESLSIRISPKMWAVIAAIASSLYIFVPIVARWLEALLGKP